MPYVVPPEKVAFYREHGWVVLEDVVSAAEIQRIKGVADDILLGRLDAGKLRADLGGFLDQVKPGTENIVQIAWPTDITSSLDENEFIQSSRAISVGSGATKHDDPPKTKLSQKKPDHPLNPNQAGRAVRRRGGDVGTRHEPVSGKAAAHKNGHAVASGPVLLYSTARPPCVQLVACVG